ncbi:MFS transporter [Brevibacillus reuszeri]|uniref:MFS transporter n=1 Tax=Brevibacillus reuszeri TaxID=54915 RepID=A0A0K9YL22_9BACL|nr:MFS transporter [Brevibacillus reuszeri]KNB69389.1 hypothetical protein ADS79_26185 [Brevibacillus reuszeri]MED1860299.1 MFS transporter [Brevibacillus reuszeri]GED70812.1 MFS transporter [Brevibacillus reuszeri]
MKNHAWLDSNVLLLFIYSFFTKFHLWMPIYVLYLQQERGLSLATIGIVEGIGWVAAALAEVPAGIVADRFGRNRALMVGAFVMAPAMVLYAYTDWFPMICFLQIVWSLGGSFLSGADQALLYDYLQERGLGNFFSKAVSYQLAIMRIASAIAGIIGGWLAAYSLGFPFFVCGVLSFGAGCVAFFIKEPKQPDEAETKQNESLIRFFLNTSSKVWRAKSLRNVLLYSAILAVPAFCFTFLFVSPFLHEKGMAIEWLGLVFILIQGMSILGSIVSYHMEKRLGEAATVTTFTVLMALSILMLPILPDLSGIICMVLTSFFYSIIEPVLIKMTNQRISGDSRSTLLSYSSMLKTIILAVLVPFFGKLAEETGYPVLCLLIAIVLISLPVVLLRKEKGTATR